MLKNENKNNDTFKKKKTPDLGLIIDDDDRYLFTKPNEADIFVGFYMEPTKWTKWGKTTPIYGHLEL